MKNFLPAKLLILILIAAAIITTGLRCNFITPSAKELLEPVELTWWGTDNNTETINQLLADYQQIHPNIRVRYRKLRPEEIETEIINALAEDRGPDIFSIQNTEIDKYINKITPLPPTTRLAFQTVQKSLGIKEETLVEVREIPTITVGQLERNFIDVVKDDVVRNNKIYGLPLYVDTLALFYNQDLFNNAGIPLPPNNWLQFQDYVKRLTFQDKQGNLIQSGAAIGQATNIQNYFDLISLLMMQNGAQMTVGDRAFFAFVPPSGDKSYNPGPEALRFYTDFANPAREVYTWNQDFANSIDAFAGGNVAMMFAYQRDIEALEAKRQGNLNYNIGPVPQIEGRESTNLASYAVQTVSLKTKYANEAWDFIQFISSQTQAKKYLDLTGRATALRSLVNEQVENDNLTIFANQLLTSKSWYHGNNIDVAKNAFAQMLSDVLVDGINAGKAAEVAAQKIEQTL